MLNARHTCPAYAKAIINCYRSPARLFVAGGKELVSSEGTTQGCPFAMIMYAIALMPMIRQLMKPPEPPEPPGTPVPKQAWYADDSQAAGKLECLKKWWDVVNELGPDYGYHPKASKTILIVKREHLAKAKEVFENTQIKILDGGARDEDNGHRDLGAAIGSSAFVEKHLKERVSEWAKELETLADIALTQPHAAHAAYTFGLKSRWVYLQRTMQTLPDLLSPLEELLRNKLLPALLGTSHPMSDRRRALYALPPREGGLGIADPTREAATHFTNSRILTATLRQKLTDGDTNYDIAPAVISRIKTATKKARHEAAKKAADELAKHTSQSEKKLMEYNRRKGAGAIFTTIPLERYGFDIKCKEDYRDILRLRYRLRIPNLPRKCVCGKDYTLDHSQMCKSGGFIHMRHDEPKNLFAALCSQVHNDVEVEPKLIPLSGEQMRLRSQRTRQTMRAQT